MHLSLQERRRVQKRGQRRRELLRRKEKGRREGARDRQRQGDTVTDRQRETEREAEIQKAVIGESQTHCCVFNCVWTRNSHSESYCSCYSVAKSCLTLVTPWTVTPQAPQSLRSPRQEYWSGLPLPPPGDPPGPGIEPKSPALAGRFFTIWATREA